MSRWLFDPGSWLRQPAGSRCLCFVAGLLAATTWPAAARASEVHATSRTIGEGYVVRVPGEGGELLPRRRLAQYVNLGVYDLLPPRESDQRVRAPEDGQLRIVTSMRLRHDFGQFQHGSSGLARNLLESIDGRQIDLLYGYVEGENLGGVVDVRMGRQFEMSGLDWYVFDGGWLRFRLPLHLAVEVFGGLQVDGSAMFGYPTHELDGTAATPEDRAFSPVVGAAFGTHGLRAFDMRMAYRRTWSPALLNRELEVSPGETGLSTGVDQEIVSTTAAVRLLRGRLSPYGAVRYNLGTSRFDDVSVGMHWNVTAIHSMRVQYLRTVPSFDLDSVFNLFALTPFEDVRVVYQVRPTARWTLLARFQARLSHRTTTEALDHDPGDTGTIGYGGGMGAAYQRRRFAARFDGFGFGGDGGVRVGGWLDTRIHLWWDRLALDGRVSAVTTQNDDDDEWGYAVALQQGANVRLWPGIYVNLLAEELFTQIYDVSFRMLAVFSVEWGMRVGRL